MTPEEKFDNKIWEILQKIKEKMLFSGNEQYVLWKSEEYDLLFGNNPTFIFEEGEEVILKKIEDLGAIKKKKYNTAGMSIFTPFDLHNWHNLSLKILQPKFDEVYTLYQNKFEYQSENAKKTPTCQTPKTAQEIFFCILEKIKYQADLTPVRTKDEIKAQKKAYERTKQKYDTEYKKIVSVRPYLKEFDYNLCIGDKIIKLSEKELIACGVLSLFKISNILKVLKQGRIIIDFMDNFDNPARQGRIVEYTIILPKNFDQKAQEYIFSKHNPQAHKAIKDTEKVLRKIEKDIKKKRSISLKKQDIEKTQSTQQTFLKDTVKIMINYLNNKVTLKTLKGDINITTLQPTQPKWCAFKLLWQNKDNTDKEKIRFRAKEIAENINSKEKTVCNGLKGNSDSVNNLIIEWLEKCNIKFKNKTDFIFNDGSGYYFNNNLCKYIQLIW